MAQLESIVYKPSSAPVCETGYTRTALQQAELVRDYGIEGDSKGGGNRQLNIMTLEVLQMLGAEGFQTQPGKMGEQLTVTGLDRNTLKAGDRIRIGDQAVVEMTEPRTGCAKFERHQSKLRTEAAGRLGMMARVVAGGTIKVGDEVRTI
jgi:MOSC domain-containing protein YiiM